MGAAQHPVILNVGDDEAGRCATTRLLTQAGYAVQEAGTGAEALARAATGCVDLILLDVNLPDRRGTEVIQRLRADPATARIPILCLSATSAALDSVAAALAAGADAYLTEPVAREVLRAQVRTLLRMGQLQRELVQAREEAEEHEQELQAANEEMEVANEELQVAQEELGRQQARLQAVLDALPVTVAIAEDASCQVITLNPAGAEMYRVGPAENVSASSPEPTRVQVRHFINGRELRSSRLPMQRAVAENRELRDLEMDIVMPDGRRLTVLCSAVPVPGEDGQPAGAVATVVDITERKQAEEALRAGEERFRSLFENMLDGYAYCRVLYEGETPADFICLAVNGAFEKLTGLKDVVGKRAREVIPGLREDNPELFEILGRVARSSRPERFEVYLDSLGLWFSIAVYSPAPEHFVAVFDNITARKQAEAERERLQGQLLAAERARAEIAERMTAETNHRMKNNLMLVASVLEMQAGLLPPGSPPAGALREATTRVTALSAVHEHLYEGRSGQVELCDVLRRVGEMAVQALTAGDVDFPVQGEPIYVSSKVGSTLAMLVNELITNAIKYGGPDEDGVRRIRVSIRMDDAHLRFLVWNSGNPVPEGFDVSGREGLGLQLAQGVVQGQLRGSFALLPHRLGTLAVVVFDEGILPAAGSPEPV